MAGGDDVTGRGACPRPAACPYNDGTPMDRNETGMPDGPGGAQEAAPTGGALLSWSLRVLGGLTAVAGTLAAPALIASPLRGARPAGALVLLAVTGVLGTWSLAGLLWGLAWLIDRRVAREAPRVERSVGRASRPFPPPPAPSPPTDRSLPPVPPTQSGSAHASAGPSGRAEPPDAIRALEREVRELQAILLMDDDERRERLGELRVRAVEEAADRVRAAAAAGDVERATEALERFRRQAGRADGDWNELDNELTASLEQARADEIRRRTRRIEDLMAMGSFRPARQEAGELCERFPNSPEAAQLADRVHREAEAYDSQQRQRLVETIRRNAEQRRWREALSAARELLESHPNSPEAEQVLQQMDTLEENARLGEARALRDSIRELIRRGRYAEAVEMGEDLVRRFPRTAAAEELRRQLPRLRERAAEA